MALVTLAGPGSRSPSRHSSLDGPHPSFGESVEVGAAWRQRQGLQAGVFQDISVGGAELRVAVGDQKAPTLEEGLVFHGHVPSHLGHPRFVRVFGDPGQVDPAGIQLDEKERIKGSGTDGGPGFVGEEVGGNDGGGVAGQEIGPTLAGRRVGV